MLTLFVLLATTAVVLSVRFQRRLLTPMALYSLVWILAVLAASWSERGYLPLAGATWSLIFTGFAAVAAGCVCGAVLASSGPPVFGPRRERGELYDEQLLERYYWVALALLVGSVALDVAQALPLLSEAGGLKGVLSGTGLGYREAQNSAAAAATMTGFGGGSFAIAVLGYFLFLGNVTLVWGGYYAATGRWRRAMSPLLLVAIYSLFTLQRFAFVYSLLILFFSYIYHRRLLGRARGGSLRPWVVLATLAVVVVFLPLQLRGQATNSTSRFDSVIDYFAGGVAGLNQTLIDQVPAPTHVPAYGTYTFFGAASILERLGVHLVLPPNTLPYLSISSTRSVENNVDTWLLYPYYDLGIAGVFLIGFGLGLGGTYLDASVMRRGRLAYVTPASLLLATIVMGFFGLSLIRDLRWLVLTVAAVAVTPRVTRRTALRETPQSGPSREPESLESGQASPERGRWPPRLA
jgi:oligosaccharide repeat unit polymerase